MLVVKSSVPSINLTMARGLTSIFLFLVFLFGSENEIFDSTALSISLSLNLLLLNILSPLLTQCFFNVCVCWVAHESSPHSGPSSLNVCQYFSLPSCAPQLLFLHPFLKKSRLSPEKM